MHKPRGGDIFASNFRRALRRETNQGKGVHAKGAKNAKG